MAGATIEDGLTLSSPRLSAATVPDRQIAHDSIGADEITSPVENSAQDISSHMMSCDAACSQCMIHKVICGGLGRDSSISVEFPVPSPLYTIPARRLIQHPKDWGDTIPMICSGWAMSSISLPDGRRQILSFLLPGGRPLVGNLLMSTSGNTVEAITEVTYRKFKRQDIKDALFGRLDVLEKIFTMWAEINDHTDQLSLDLGRRHADERIARLILRLAEKIGLRSTVRTLTFDFPLRHRHIADATGLTPVHVSKILRILERAGIISIADRMLTIHNIIELRRLAFWR